MQHALKLALVDPKHLAYKELSKSAKDQTRAGMSVGMTNMLRNEVPDDVKIKLYNQALSRFLSVKSNLEEEPTPPANYWLDDDDTDLVTPAAKLKPVKQSVIESQPAPASYWLSDEKSIQPVTAGRKRKAAVSLPLRKSARPHVKWSKW